MNILVLNYEYPPLGGGAAPVCRDLAAGMVKEGHHVVVVTMGFTGLPVYERKDGVEIYRVKCMRQKAHACMPWEAYTYILSARHFLRKHLLTHAYDVCHAHFVIPTGPIALWVKWKYGIPYVITAHGSDVEGYNEKAYMEVLHRLLRPVWRKVVREAHAAIAPSEYLLRLMKQEMNSEKYVLIHNGVNIEKYRSEGTEKEKRILLMGRMQKAKNIQSVFKAITMIPDAVWGDWRVDVLGDGPYREELEYLCEQLRINSRVQFHGWIENGSTEQLGFLKRTTIYISASHFENCPMAVLEAMAAGCYPLLSDIEGHRQFFGDGRESNFFPAENAGELSRKMQMLLSEDPQRLCLFMPDLLEFAKQYAVKRYVNLLEKAI